ncbi:MAG TPA: YigZ family protein [Candidatus Cloacimonadota bacterium]|nr:YigZ family protein [Candidatus Cloacimonadota bacterium]
MTIWKTVREPVEAKIVIRRSHFIAWMAPLSEKELAMSVIGDRSKDFADATHNCWAWIHGLQREDSHYSDDGEPSGTAGKPMYNALMSAGLTNVAAVVTRYFGGAKLGVRGLIDAYTESVEAALAEAKLIKVIPMQNLSVDCEYAEAQQLQGLLPKLGGAIGDVTYDARVRFEISVPEASLTELCDFLDSKVHSNGLNYTIED